MKILVKGATAFLIVGIATMVGNALYLKGKADAVSEINNKAEDVKNEETDSRNLQGI